jgi:uncharacterized protein YcbK (DUF882 family)
MNLSPNIVKAWQEFKHFKINEFDSPDDINSGQMVSIELIKILEQLRTACGFPFKIDSGYRSIAHNTKVKGEANSSHTRGLAVDVGGLDSTNRFTFIKEALKLRIRRIGIGGTFIHFDIDYSLPQNVCWLYGAGREIL